MTRELLKRVNDLYCNCMHVPAVEEISKQLRIPFGDAEKLYKLITSTDPAYYGDIFNVKDYWAK